MPTAPTTLTATDLRILEFERTKTWWAYSGHKESSVLAEFGLSMTAYNQRLLAIIRNPESEAHDPITVRRLRDRVDARRRVGHLRAS